MPSWAIETIDIAHHAPPGLLSALRNQEIAIVRVCGIPISIARAATDAVRSSAVTANTYLNATLTTVGPYLARGLATPDDYFSRASELDQVFAEPRTDPRTVVRKALEKALRVPVGSPLKEPSGHSYATAVVRLHYDGSGNPLHNDMIARDARGSGLLVEKSTTQLSAIYCLQECREGGELVHYRRRWQETHECHKVDGRLGYEKTVLDGAPTAIFRPAEGDLYIIDPTHYHEILPVVGQTRITMGSFVLFFDDAMSEGWQIA